MRQCLLTVAAFVAAISTTVRAQSPAPATPAGATVLMTNHAEFERAYDRARLAQLPRAAAEKHPYETDTATAQRYFEMGGLCAEAQRLSMEPTH